MISRGMLVLLVACGGDGGGGGGGGGDGDVTPFIGVYTTTSHTRAQMQGSRVSCTSAGEPVASAAPFFQVAIDSFFMDPAVLRVANCADAAGAMCTDTLVTLHAGGPGLEDESANSQTGGGVMCQLYFSHAQATLTGGVIEIEVLDKFDAPDLASSECTLERAEALASSPDCQSVERWVGTRR